jgi:hypothetical protein
LSCSLVHTELEGDEAREDWVGNDGEAAAAASSTGEGATIVPLHLGFLCTPEYPTLKKQLSQKSSIFTKACFFHFRCKIHKLPNTKGLQKPGVFSGIHKVEKEEALGPGRCKTLGLTLGWGLRIEWKWEQQVRHCLRHEEQPRKKNRLIAQEEEKQPKNHRGEKMEREKTSKSMCTNENQTSKFHPPVFNQACFSAFAKSNKKLKTTSERDTQLELLGVWRIHQNLKNKTTERCTTWPTWGLSKSNKSSEQHQREIHSLNYLVFAKSTKTSKQHQREMHNLNDLCSPKSNKKLRTCSQRDASLELLGVLQNPTKSSTTTTTTTERCTTWSTLGVFGNLTKSSEKHHKEMHHLNYWVFF